MNILATSGGVEPTPRRRWAAAGLLRYAMALSGASRPRICMLFTAAGDDPGYINLGYEAFAGIDCVVSHLALFPMPNRDPERLLTEQDVIWVWGGSVVNLLAVWRAHGLPEILRTAWQNGVVLAGVSAGSLCWHLGGTTDSYGPDLRPVTDALGFLPYSNCPHYDSEEQRRPLYQSLVGAGTLPAGWATDDGVGLHFAGTELAEVVSERDGGYGYRVERSPDGTVEETRLTPRRLPD